MAGNTTTGRWSGLVLGGARSGKSHHAEALAGASGLAPVLVATGEPGDPEMAERIARHRAERGAHWTTIEEPIRLVEALHAAARPDRFVVVDCLTLWLTNLLLRGADAEAEARRLAAALPGLEGPLALVSNEIGFGLVPETTLGRQFRDIQGRANQSLAAACDHVVLVVAGLPLALKGAPPPSP